MCCKSKIDFINIRTSAESMLAKIKNAHALHTTSRTKGFNSHLPDFSPVYSKSQRRMFACSEDEYIDIWVSTDLDETVVDETGKRPSCDQNQFRLTIAL